MARPPDLRPAGELAATKPHGTRIRYMGGCKCLKCRCANSNYETARARARKAGDWNGTIDAAAARAWIVQLGRQGAGYKLVADAAKVARSVVAKIKSGERLKIRARTSKALLAVTLEAARGNAALIPAKATWRLLRAMLEEGYTRGQIAIMLGRKTPALQIRTDRVTVKTAAAVQTLHRQIEEGRQNQRKSGEGIR